MSNPNVFNPLDKSNLGKSVFDALLEQPVYPLSEVGTFAGAGIYAIYYCGDFEPYARLSDMNQEGASFPIYAGKATPKGGRKGIEAEASLDSNALAGRLRNHRASIDAVGNLELEHFSYRYLIVDDIWIGLGEALLIQHFRPLWNQLVDGFGNHNPGKGRRSGRKPLWDELHPGRDWAKKLSPPKKELSEILSEISTYMSDLHGQ
jgi:hypothetical protein